MARQSGSLHRFAAGPHGFRPLDSLPSSRLTLRGGASCRATPKTPRASDGMPPRSPPTRTRPLPTRIERSDADQNAAEEDQAQANTDQAASDRDQAAADRDFATNEPSATAAQTHEVSRVQRERGTAERGAAHLLRSQTGAHRLRLLRFATSTPMDAIRRRQNVTTSPMRLTGRPSGRLNGGQDDQRRKALAAVEAVRKRASDARDRAAEDRQRAADDRKRAAEDRRAPRRIGKRPMPNSSSPTSTTSPAPTAGASGSGSAQRDDPRATNRNSLIVAYVDVNGLKAVNDSHGHAVGDALLHEVAATIRLRLRPYDPLIRVGGDEFVCAVSGVDIDDARARFDEIEAAIVGGSISVG